MYNVTKFYIHETKTFNDFWKVKFVKIKYRLLSFLLVFFMAVFSAGDLKNAYADDVTAINTNMQDASTQAAINWPAYPDIVAEAGVLIEVNSGSVIYDKNCHNKMYPASITKIMTTLLAIENGNLTDSVTYYPYDVTLESGAASIGRKPGDTLSLKDTLYGVMLASANECANAAGEYVARNSKAYNDKIAELSASGQPYDESQIAISVFADMMNDRAAKAGALGTHFCNPNGLFDENHYTTPYDMAMIMRQAIKNQEFLNIESSTSYEIPATSTNPALTVAQRHKMFYKNNPNYYEGVFAGKTGYTDQSGSTLVTCATRNGITLISVVMKSNAENVCNDTKALLDYGFNNFYVTPISDNSNIFSFDSHDNIANIDSIFDDNSNNIRISSDGTAILPVGVNLSDCKTSISFDDIANSPYDNTVAKLHYSYNNVETGSTYLILDKGKRSFSFGPSKSVKNNSKPEHKSFIIINIWTLAGIALLIIIIIFIVKSRGKYGISHKHKRRKSYRRHSKRRRKRRRL